MEGSPIVYACGWAKVTVFGASVVGDRSLVDRVPVLGRLFLRTQRFSVYL